MDTEDIIDTTVPSFIHQFQGFVGVYKGFTRSSSEDRVDIPVYTSIEQATLAMQVAIDQEQEEFDEDEEHAITARDEVLVGLVKYLAHGRKHILHIVDMYCGKSPVVDAAPLKRKVGDRLQFYFPSKSDSNREVLDGMISEISGPYYYVVAREGDQIIGGVSITEEQIIQEGESHS